MSVVIVVVTMGIEILRILTSSLKWEGEEELYVRGDE